MQVSSDGVVYWRQGISPSCPSGQAWIQLLNPDNTKFRSVEAGRNGIFAIDTGNKLWLRVGVSVQYPEGLSWNHVSDNVRSVTVGDSADIWAVLDSHSGHLSSQFFNVLGLKG